MSKPKFCVYALRRPSGEVFYIGKGRKSRPKAHEREAKSGVANLKCDLIREVWAAGQQIETIILFETDDEQSAYDEEIRQIALHGRTGLVNATNGGGGIRGLTAEQDIQETLCKCRFCTPEIAAFLAKERF